MAFAFQQLIRWFLSAIMIAASQPAYAETWRIITLDWPPYTAESLANKGAAAKALTATMKAVGIDVEFVFMPWSRGYYEVRKDEYVGIFPSWTANGFESAKLSPPLFHSPIGFVYSSAKPHPWQSLQDFKGLRIGIVQDYHYPEELNRLGKTGLYTLQAVNTDEQNLFKVAYKRIDLTIMDLVNARFLIERRNPQLKPLLTVDPKVFKSADLFIALKNDAKFNDRFAKIKKGLRKVSSQKIVDDAVSEILK